MNRAVSACTTALTLPLKRAARATPLKAQTVRNVLMIIVAVVAVFAMQNSEDIAVHFLNWGITASFAALIGITYLLGMLSGWSVMGALRSSVSRVTEYRR